jgi:hypothetical protein
MSTPFVEVITPDVPPQYVDLASDRIVVGSAITCQVAVERPEFAREHMLFSPRPEGCYVALARGAPTPVTQNGMPIDRVIVPWGTELAVGPVRFVLHDGSVPRTMYIAAKASGKAPGEKPKVNPVILIAGLIILPLVGWLMLSTPEEDLPRANVAAPALFDPLERPCAQSDPVQAQVLANESARQAVAKAERLPFRYQDGIEAVNHHAMAAACFRAVGDAQNAEAQLAAARALSARIEDEFRNHRFRLERALEQRRNDDALIETRLIKNLVAHRQGPYLTWLQTLERRLQLAVDQAAAAANQ